MGKKPGLLGNWYCKFLSYFQKVAAKFALKMHEPTAQEVVDFAYGLAHKSLHADQVYTKQQELSFSKAATMTPEWEKMANILAKQYDRGIMESAKMENVKRWGLDLRAKVVDSYAHTMAAMQKALEHKLLTPTQELQLWTDISNVQSLSSLIQHSFSKGILRLTELDGVKTWVNPEASQNAASLLRQADELKGQDMRQYASYERAIHFQKVGWDKLGGTLAEQREAMQLAPKIIAEGNAIPEFVKAHATGAQVNRDLIKLLVDSGRLSKAEAATWHPDTYTPSYDIAKNGDFFLDGGSGLVHMGNIKDIPALKHLTQGKKEFLPIMEAKALNVEVLTRAAVTNYATKHLSFMLRDLGLARLTKPKKDDRHLSTQFYVDGEAKSMRVDREWGVEQAEEALRRARTPDDKAKAQQILEFLSDTNYISLPNLVANLSGTVMVMPTAFKAAAWPARVLHGFITRNPLYPLRQFPRDMLNAYVLNGGDTATFAKFMPRYIEVVRGIDKNASFLERTGAGESNILKGDFTDIGRELNQLMGKGGGLSGMIRTMEYMADKWATSGDMTVRSMLFETGKKRGMTDMEARRYAIEGGTNFKTRGSSSSVYVANMLTPFLNSQIRGIDTAVRALRGQAVGQDKTQAFQSLLVRGTLLAATSTAIHALLSDEDWYQRVSPEERVANHLVMFPGMDTPFKFPISFESGLLIHGLPNMIMTAMEDKNGIGKQEALKMLRGQIISNLLPGGGVNVGEYGLIPTLGIPGAALTPVLAWYTNTNKQTGAPIESKRLQALEPGKGQPQGLRSSRAQSEKPSTYRLCRSKHSFKATPACWGSRLQMF
jgi:hypothetical protein